MIKFLLLFVIITSASLPVRANVAASPKSVFFGSYYNFPPYMFGSERVGLVAELCQMLTEQSGGRYHFNPRYYPRKRIDRLLLSEQLGLAAFVNPAWFADDFIVTQGLLSGYDVIISPVNSPIDYISKESVANKRFVGVIGHHYPLLNGTVGANLKFRVDSSSLNSLFKLIANNRGDFALVPGLVALHYRTNNSNSKKIHYSAQLESAYTRHLLMSAKHLKLRDYIDGVMASEPGHRQWMAILLKYNISSQAIIKQKTINNGTAKTRLVSGAVK